MGIQFKLQSNGVFFDVNFSDRLNLVKGSSGTGKTFLCNTVHAYCVSEEISCAFINNRVAASADKDAIYCMCRNKEIIILDDTELYLDSELFDRIRDLSCTVIVVRKVTFGLNMEDVHLYFVNFKGNQLRTRRLQ